MKVLALTHIYPSVSAPTRGPYNHYIFKAISRHCDVRVVAPVPWSRRIRRPQEFLQSLKEVDYLGLPTVYPNYWSIPGVTALHARAMYLSLRATLERIYSDFPFDVILAAWAYPDGVAAQLIAREYGCPLVINVLGSDVNVLTRYAHLARLIRDSMRSAQFTIAVSGALRDRLIDIGVPSNRIVVHHNGVDGDQFAIRDRKAVRERLRLPHDRRLICFVGNLEREKGIDVLVEALKELDAHGCKDTDLIIVGGGSMEQALHHAIKQTSIEHRVHFVGRKVHSDISDWIAASDVMCLPSRREGCPNVALEALSSGRPVVATDVGGLPELINAENGILVPSEDPKALAEGLAAALHRNWEPAILRNSVEYLSWNAVGEGYYLRLVEALEASKTPIQSRLANGFCGKA